MKKLLIILLSLNFITLSSQYTFNYKFCVKDFGKKDENINYCNTEIYINSKNANYELYHYKTHEIRLFDYERKTTVYFWQRYKNGRRIFKYLDKGSFSSSETERKIDHIEVKEIGDNMFSISVLGLYKNERFNLGINALLEEADEDLLYLYKLDLDHNLSQEILKSLRGNLIALKGNSNYIIKELEKYYKDGYPATKIKLVKSEKIEMVVK